MASIQEIVKKAYKCKNDIKALTTELDQYKLMLQQYFDKNSRLNNIKKIEVGPIIAQMITRVTISYFPDKIAECLDKEIANEVLDKDYVVTNMPKLISLMKGAGVNPVEFKSCIRAIKTVNKEKLKQLFDVGEITLEQLAGCYDAKVVKSIDIKGDSN